MSRTDDTRKAQQVVRVVQDVQKAHGSDGNIFAAIRAASALRGVRTDKATPEQQPQVQPSADSVASETRKTCGNGVLGYINAARKVNPHV